MATKIPDEVWKKFNRKKKIHTWFFYKRLIIAAWLDKNPAYCWSKLVDWANLYLQDGFWLWVWPYHSENSIDSKTCSPNDGDTPWAYCGKCDLARIKKESGEKAWKRQS